MHYSFSLRERVLMLILALILLSAAWYQFVYSNCQDQMTVAQNDVADMQVSIETASTQLASMNSMQATVDAKKAAGVQPTKLPSYDNLQQLTASLNTILANTNSYTLGFTDPVSASGSVMRRDVSLSFTCASYAQAKEVIAALDANSAKCVIGDISISMGAISSSTSSIVTSVVNTSSSSSTVSVSMKLSFYESTAS